MHGGTVGRSGIGQIHDIVCSSYEVEFGVLQTKYEFGAFE